MKEQFVIECMTSPKSVFGFTYSLMKKDGLTMNFNNNEDAQSYLNSFNVVLKDFTYKITAKSDVESLGKYLLS